MQTYSDFFKTLHDETSPTGYLGRGTHYSVLRAVVFHDPMGKPLPEGQFADFAVIWDEDHDTRVMEPIEEIYRRGMLSSFLMFGEHKGSFTAIISNKIPLAIEAIPFNPAFLLSIDDLELFPGTTNRLKENKVVYVGDLVQKTEEEMLQSSLLGRKSIHHIKEVLAQAGLRLGMEVPGSTRENIEDLVKGKARVAFLETEINAICHSLNDPWPAEVAALGSARNPIISDEDEKVNLYLKNLEMLWQLGTVARQPQKPAMLVTAGSGSPVRQSAALGSGTALPPRRIVRPQRPAINADGIAPGWTTDPSEADRDPFS
jgi:hypothetical protein